MKASVGFLVVSLLVSSVSLAQAKMKCDITTQVAAAAGYLTGESGPEKLTIVADIKSGEATYPRGVPFASCAKAELAGHQLHFCASSTDFKNVYDVFLNVDSFKTNQDRISTAAQGKLGVLVTTSKLDFMNQVHAIAPLLAEKLYKADIHAPLEYSIDSLQIDDALKAGAKLGLITEGEVAVFTIENCEIK